MRVTVSLEREKKATLNFKVEYDSQSREWTAYHRTGEIHDDRLPSLGEALGLIAEEIEELVEQARQTDEQSKRKKQVPMNEKSNETEGQQVKVGEDKTADQIKTETEQKRTTQRTKTRVVQDRKTAKASKPKASKPKASKPAAGTSVEQVSKAMSQGYAGSTGAALYGTILDYLISHPKGATPDEIAVVTGQSSTAVRGIIRRQAKVSTRKGDRFAEVREGKHWLFIVDAPKGAGCRLLYKVTKAGKVPPEVQQYL